MAGLLQLIKDLYFGPPPGKGVIQDLEYAMRTKGGLTKEEDTKLQIANLVPTAAFALFSGLGSYAGWFSLGLGNKLLGFPPSPVFARFCAATGGAYIMGTAMYRGTLHECPVSLLNTEGRMKMELANIILTKHSDDAYLVKAMKKHFFAEHLFDDLHQDQPLLRWHPRRSYTDSAFVERLKEIEAINSNDEARSVSGETTADNKPSGDLMEDPLACILGSPGDVESNNPPGKTSTVLKRSELRARRRSHRHHHRHADDKFAAL
ncbi:hypothetical protein SEVIR_9G245900v4 [Setaria viridis]|uniref:Uncharacterized protein n=1 Tax=Setaria viridis TaxID=4556 RepID=A0A4U6SYW2_SETVI|nr:uncharacterized protein LOC117837280 [Setaria viridis]TKV93741.1 hypothetical protein SEVIR_9G245900v2 [Setaria viridis]